MQPTRRPLTNTSRILVLGLLLATALAATAQAPQSGRLLRPSAEAGLPFMRNWDPKEYAQNPQNWCAVQDRRGMVYVGNQSGILEYDGQHWNYIAVGAGLTVRGLALDDKGTLYVGAAGEFGMLRPDTLGLMEFVSLKHQLPEEVRDFANIWNLFCVGDAVYFNTGFHLVRYSPAGTRFYKARNEDSFHSAYAVGQQVYVRENGVGLQLLKDEKLELLPAGDLFAHPRQGRVDAMLPYDSKHTLIVTRYQGMYLWDGQGLMPFETEMSGYLDTNQVYHGAALPGGRFAFATLRGGVGVMDKQGRIQHTFTRKSGLLDNNCHWVMMDTQGGMWVALNKGMARLEYPGPYTLLNEASGLQGTVSAMQRHGGRFYVATSSGVFVMQTAAEPGMQPRFVAVKGIFTQAWQLTVARGTLLAATTRGLYRITGAEAKPLSGTENPTPAFAFCQPAADSNRLYVGMQNGITVWQYAAGNWREKGNLAGVEEAVRWITESSDGSKLWIGNLVSGLSRIDLKAGSVPLVQHYDDKQGLRDLAGNQLYRVGKQELLATQNGLFRFDEQQNRFVPDFSFGEKFSDGYGIKFIQPMPDGSAWLYTYHPSENFKLSQCQRLADGSYGEVRSASARIRRFVITRSYADTDSVLWLGGDDGLLRYDLRVPKAFGASYLTSLRRVLASDSIPVFLGAARDTSTDYRLAHRAVLAYRNNSLRFDFAAQSYDETLLNEYQYQLLPFEAKASAWGSTSYRDYTNLPEGDYTFVVRSRNAYNEGGEVDRFYFTILPPWYRTWWAYVLYGVALIGGVFGFVQLRLRQLQAENEKLERIVTERTAEVVRQKDEIQQASNEIKQKNAELENAYEEIRATNENLTEAYHVIEEKNKDITDSINYASRIQAAFLPSLEEIRRHIPNIFILFKPKDIVSGDFYWFSYQHPYAYVAGIDCTGHGVPGGFMSMMGNALLNEIVVLEKNQDPGRILEMLHHRVQHTLRQHLPGATTKDGMEVCLWRIDTEKNEMIYTGAMRPMVIVRNNELIDYDPTKNSIGGSQLTEVETFPTFTITPQPGDMMYTFSDGYGDQFGGERGKKFMVKNLKTLLLEIHQLPMEEQKSTMDARIEAWRGNREQIDDILVIGIRF